jgi:K+-sensing histidine kinase KdpD
MLRRRTTATEPRIDIEGRSEGATVRIDIRDNGGGITREEASTVFEKFARGDRANLEPDAGLGLPISRAIMRAMGGDLTVEFGQGDRNFFRLTFGPEAPAGDT